MNDISILKNTLPGFEFCSRIKSDESDHIISLYILLFDHISSVINRFIHSFACLLIIEVCSRIESNKSLTYILR